MPQNFIHDVIAANVGNECPKEYMLWSAFAALSLASGRRYFLATDHFDINTQLYVILVGPAGNRKTFARDYVVRILKEAIPDVILSANCESHQAIIQYMAEDGNQRGFTDHQGANAQERPFGMFVSELMNYLKIDPIGMTSFLTDIRDSKEAYNYKIKGKDGTGIVQTLWYPYFVLLACTAPDWLTTQIKSDEFCGGFGRRTIFVCNDSDVRMKPHKDDVAKAAELRAIECLRKIHSGAARMELTKEADEWFWGKWYIDKNLNKLSDDKFLRSFGRSRHIQVLTVAQLARLSEIGYEPNWTPFVELRHIQLAIGLIGQVEANIGMITEKMGKSEVIQGQETILNHLRGAGGVMPMKELRVKTLKEFKNTMEQYQSLDFMVKNEIILQDIRIAKYGERPCYAIPGMVTIVPANNPPKPNE